MRLLRGLAARRIHPTAETHSEEMPLLPRLEGAHVFSVDDEPDARELLRRVLEDQGALVAGYQAHLTKPFDVGELILVIANLVGR